MVKIKKKTKSAKKATKKATKKVARKPAPSSMPPTPPKTAKAVVDGLEKAPITRKKAAPKKKRSTVKKKTDLPVIARRQQNPLDDIAAKLLTFGTIQEMHDWAAKVKGIKEDKLTKALVDFHSGTNAGLIRMRIGNLVRGARQRAAKSPAAKKKANAAKLKGK